MKYPCDMYIVKCKLCNEQFEIQAQNLKKLDQRMRDHVRTNNKCYNILLQKFKSSHIKCRKCGTILTPNNLRTNTFECVVCGHDHFDWYFGMRRPYGECYEVLCPNCGRWIALRREDIENNTCPECMKPIIRTRFFFNL